MKTQAKIRVPMVPTVFEESESLTKLKGKKSSAKRVQEHREKERQKPGFDNEKVKEETCLWVAAIGTRHPKCLFDRKSKDSSFKLHPENKHNKISKKDHGLAQKPENQRAQVKGKEVSTIYLNKDIQVLQSNRNW